MQSPVTAGGDVATTPSSRLGGAEGTGLQLAAPALAAMQARGGAARARSKWVEPLAGLAAGLALASLAVSLGFDDALAAMAAAAATALALLAGIRFIVRRVAFGAAAMAEGPGAADSSRLSGGTRSAKEQFEALQLANDEGDLQRLRECLIPAMFDAAQAGWRTRRGAVQQTQVFGLEAQVVDAADLAGEHVVSVRFTGRVRGQASEVPQDLDETWHFTKPRASRSGWMLAGIQPAPPIS
ncbi:Tim44-like domain-containing protein [Ramlibacter sp. XY19]|uniref:Tim44 domain-containing protein n=1 Tax=Ramlibacter paludis TaxID=2908000 RepID=UPI0023DBAC56|nr:Tim44-like domain-containing protein [Ramlibacter paludis]MCG2592348.1 Tim44-like domain-containing protein [Ramlibacter paludis]